MKAFVHDLQAALRQLSRSPGFTAAAVLILALAIGLNSAVFSVVNAVLFRPLPVAAPEDLVAIYRSTPRELMAASALTTADYEEVAGGSHCFTSVLAYTYSPMALEAGGENCLVLGVRATPNFFAGLGLKPFLGRFFTAEDVADTQEAVLSYMAWRRRSGHGRRVLGTTIVLNGRSATVVGVAPKEFFGLTRGVSPELWMPIRLHGAGRDRRRDRDLGWLWVVGRRAPRVTLEQVRAELNGLATRLAVAPREPSAERTFAVYPANTVRILPGVDAALGKASAVALGVVGLVLLIACTNVANLLLARAIARRREIATRRAIGASPAAVVRQLLAESIVLALLGGSLGLAVALLSNTALAALRLPLPVDLALGLALDGRVILFTLASATVTVLACGLAPALSAARGDLSVLLREGAPTAGSRAQHRLGGLLVVAQVALCCVLLVGTGLAVRSLRNAHHLDPGFDRRGVLVATLAPQLQGLTHAETEAFFGRLIDRVRALPGVESAALASHLPLSVEIAFDRVATTATTEREELWPTVDSALVDPGYFETLRIPLLHGRTFNGGDRADAPLVAVVNRSFAEHFWPGQEAVGRRLRIAGVDAAYEVVGVVRDGKYRILGEAPRQFLYRVLTQNRWRRMGKTGEITTSSETLVARTQGAAPAALSDLRRAVREVGPRVAVARLATLDQALGAALFLPRAAAALFALFGFLGLLLASLGIYSLMIYAVGQRYREIGVRMVLGATRRDIVRLVLRRGLGLGAVGIAAGLGAAAATTRTLAAVLYGVSSADVDTFLAVGVFLALVALAASYLPARRAARFEMSKALRHE